MLGGSSCLSRHRDKPKSAVTVYHDGNDWRAMVDFLRGLVPDYKWRVKGLYHKGKDPHPVLLHVWRAPSGNL